MLLASVLAGALAFSPASAPPDTVVVVKDGGVDVSINLCLHVYVDLDDVLRVNASVAGQVRAVLDSESAFRIRKGYCHHPKPTSSASASATPSASSSPVPVVTGSVIPLGSAATGVAG